jgi:hypothetical protein
MQPLVEVAGRVPNVPHSVQARIEEDGAVGPVELGQPRMPLSALAHYQLGGVATGRKGVRVDSVKHGTALTKAYYLYQKPGHPY